MRARSGAGTDQAMSDSQDAQNTPEPAGAAGAPMGGEPAGVPQPGGVPQPPAQPIAASGAAPQSIHADATGSAYQTATVRFGTCADGSDHTLGSYRWHQVRQPFDGPR